MCIAAKNSCVQFSGIEYYQKCSHMLRSDHRELRKSLVKLIWVVGGGWVVCSQGCTTEGFTNYDMTL